MRGCGFGFCGVSGLVTTLIQLRLELYMLGSVKIKRIYLAYRESAVTSNRPSLLPERVPRYSNLKEASANSLEDHVPPLLGQY
jgi:hypothetical protein